MSQYYSGLFEFLAPLITASVEMVTPEMAAAWLKRNCDNNRTLYPRTVGMYAHRIRNRLWDLNGQGVILADDGTLLDGQHRLEAIVRTGVPIPLLVVRGVNKNAFKTLDGGKIRSSVDTLTSVRAVQARYLSSALNWLARYEDDAMDKTEFPLSNMEVLGLLEDNPGLPDSVSWILARAKKGLIPPGPMAFLHYLFFSRHPSRAAGLTTFFTSVLTGAELAEDSPQYRFRRLLEDARGSATRKKVATVDLLASGILACNAFIEDRYPRSIRRIRGTAFPRVSRT